MQLSPQNRTAIIRKGLASPPPSAKPLEPPPQRACGAGWMESILPLGHLMVDGDPPSKSALPKIFDANPELKAKVEAYLLTIPEAQKQADLEKVERFVSGELTWSEIKGYPKSLLKGLAEVAYSKYQAGDYQTAESLFKGLSIIDHTNWYYRSALGAIYQKQKIYEQALEEYTVALSLNENEISTLTNRAECYLKINDLRPALKDLKRVIALDPKGTNAWVKRARALLKHVEGRAKGD